MQKILGYARRGIQSYNMISSGDKVAVGVSGGKDSLALLVSMARLRTIIDGGFELVAIALDARFSGIDTDFSPVEKLCESLSVPFVLERTDIGAIVFDVRQEKNPCSLCAKMRRGALHNAAKEFGCSRVALGHHFDDVVETFMLNLFFEGRLGCFQPVTYLSRADLTLIRPMIYMPEKDVRYFSNRVDLPVMSSPCPADGNTEREEMKQLLHKLERENPGLRYRIFGAIQRGEIDGFRMTGRMQGMKSYEDDTE